MFLRPVMIAQNIRKTPSHNLPDQFTLPNAHLKQTRLFQRRSISVKLKLPQQRARLRQVVIKGYSRRTRDEAVRLRRGSKD